ncbi:ribosome silencing factor [Sulfobacillus harzensis]|uniref:ribosome silencing factor n=1 Tax=Sulfobacillus harzensis TaxID=2729629 RepID=UPI001FAB5FEE|nr:ribosome silencing factor [Sulfobacillus harzensis]
MANALLAADTAEGKKGERVVVLDMRDVTLIADYFVIVSATNVIQVQTIADAVDEALQARGLERINQVGRARAHWVLLDYGGLVVHVFTEEERQYYNLERLWGDAVVVDRAALKAGRQ